MGTSSSYGGPGSPPPMLPPWAAPDIPEDQEPDNSPEDEQSDDKKADKDDTPTSEKQRWSTAKGSMTRFAGGDSGSIAAAGRAYVRAKGGAGKAASSAKTGRSSTAAIGGFLATVARSGFNQGLSNLGLSKLVGADVDTVFVGIMEALAPPGADLEEAAAREAVADVCESLYVRCIEDERGLELLEQFTSEDITSIIEGSVISYVYHRWLQELGARIESNAISAESAIGLEHQVKDYLDECARLDFKDIDLLKVNWQGPEGQKLITSLYQEVYAILEANE